MDYLETLTERNADFAANGFASGLKMLPSMKTIIVGCVDPRVDPADLFGLETGEAVVIRNVGGRINNALLETMDILETVAGVAGKTIGDGWNLIMLHHTDCGIIPCYKHAPELLARNLNVTVKELDRMEIADPHAAVRLDVAALKNNPDLAAGFMVSGVVYDVANGTVETVVPATRLRDEVAS